MVLDDVLSLIEEKVFFTPTIGFSLFNQYDSINSDVDLPNAHEIRRENLRKYLRSFPENPTVIIIGEAPGWRGCRFSGVPFTSEAQLCDDSLPFIKGFQSSNNRLPYKESTATIFWQHMGRHHPKFFVWNCTPFHPHEPNNLLSNRTPLNREITNHLKLLAEMISLIRPMQIVAVGKSAERALQNMKDISFTYVRHPSRGGANDFRVGIEEIFG
jgi:uracil-DNA glycosylase